MKNLENNIVSYLIAHACAFPHKNVFTILGNERDSPNKITYQELEVSVKKVAARLMDKHLKNKTALLVYQDILEFIISFLACEYAGIIPVPVPYAKGSKQLLRINSIIEDAQVGAILCTGSAVTHLQQELNSALPAGKLQIIATDGPPPIDDGYLNIPATFAEIAFIQYTSGSTGKPKGVIITGNNLIYNQQLIKNTFGCDENSVIFSWLPFHHDMGLIGNLLHTIYVGCTCILMSPLHFMQQPKAWLEGISDYKVTHSGAPNFAYDLCVNRINESELASINLSSWKVAYNGSEPIQAATIQRFINYFKPAGFNEHAFTPCYGLAEATLLVSGTKSGLTSLTVYIDKEACMHGKILLADHKSEGAKAVVSSGYPADGMKLKIISLHDQSECSELEEGEICISGESVTNGYWNKDNSDLFYEYAGEKFLRTGDLGFLYEAALFVHGRVKEMLIVRGKNYYPYDIEQAVAGCDTAIAPNGVAAFGIDDEATFVIVAEVKRASINSMDKEMVIATIDKLVMGLFGISPYDIVLTTPLGIPRTTSGKLQRMKCKALYLDNTFSVIASKLRLPDKILKKDRNALLLTQVRQNVSYETIRAYVIDIIEAKTGNLLPAILNDETDITGLGVDSLRAMEIINSINQELNISLDATKVYQHNTLSALCNIIETMLWLKTELTIGKEITI